MSLASEIEVNSAPAICGGEDDILKAMAGTDPVAFPQSDVDLSQANSE